jgi:hypothetical protein
VQDPIAVIVRFDGDPDDLIERFERARQLWIETQDADYSRPLFYAACKRREHPRGGPRARQTDSGIVIVNQATTWRLRPAPAPMRMENVGRLAAHPGTHLSDGDPRSGSGSSVVPGACWRRGLECRPSELDDLGGCLRG